MVGSNTITPSGDRYSAERFFVHPNYKPNEAESNNDIGIIKLNRTITYSLRAKPIVISTLPEGAKKLRLYGFGCTKFLSYFLLSLFGYCGEPNILQTTDLTPVANNDSSCQKPTVSNETCTYDPVVNNNLTFSKRGSACFGDSGGPLVFEELTEDQLIALVSRGSILCRDTSAELPYIGGASIFTSVAPYESWIEGIKTANP